MSFRKSIIKFEPNRVWRTYRGGKVLDTIEGKAIAEDSHYPEDWIGSVVEARNPGRDQTEAGLSFVSDDKGDRIAFRDLLKDDSDYFLGTCGIGADKLDALPLVKYLDSATRLHFQAHPTAEFARERLNSNRGKTEAYVILAIREGIEKPYIYAGFQRPPTREQLKQWILDQDIEAIEACFTPIPVQPGDVFIIPGGRPHALGEGILMLEIMEASDLAVRFEFERDGFKIPEEARFMGRGIETALDVFNLDPVDDNSIDATFRCAPRVIEDYGSSGCLEELIGKDQTSCFSVRRSIVSGDIEKSSDDGFIGVVAEGSGLVRIGNTTTNIHQWDRFYCPAGIEKFQYETSNGMTVLECYAGTN